MNRRFEIGVSFAGLVLVGASRVREAIAQGLPTPGPGGPTFPAADGGSMVGPVIAVVVALIGVLVLTVAMADLRRKRRAHAIAIEGQISDALMREPRLAGAVLTPVAQVPLAARGVPSVEIRGQVEYPELREVAVRIVRQELLRHHPDGRVEDRIFVSPPIHAGRR